MNLVRQYKKLLTALIIVCFSYQAHADRALFRVAGKAYFESDVQKFSSRLKSFSKCYGRPLRINNFSSDGKMPFSKDLIQVKLVLAVKSESSFKRDQLLTKIYGKCVTLNNKDIASADLYLSQFLAGKKELISQLNQRFPHFIFMAKKVDDRE